MAGKGFVVAGLDDVEAERVVVWDADASFLEEEVLMGGMKGVVGDHLELFGGELVERASEEVPDGIEGGVIREEVSGNCVVARCVIPAGSFTACQLYIVCCLGLFIFAPVIFVTFHPLGDPCVSTRALCPPPLFCSLS